MDEQITHRQHLVSAVLLRELNNTEGLIGVLELSDGKIRTSVAEGEAFIRDFIPVDQNKSENRWAKIEKRMPEVFASLQAGTIFSARESYRADLIKLFMSLHAVRSYNVYRLWEEGRERDSWVKGAEAWRPNGKLMAAYKREVNPDPSLADTMLLVRDFRNGLSIGLGDGLSFRDFVHTMATKFNKYLRRSRVEIGIAPQGKSFIIGDSPVLIRDSYSGRVGVFEGVGVTSANQICMPLGSRYVVALNSHKGSINKIVKLGSKEVDDINRLQIRTAHRRIFYRIDSMDAGELRAYVKAVGRISP